MSPRQGEPGSHARANGIGVPRVPKPRKVKTCKVCGAEFDPNTYGTRIARSVCSYECNRKVARKKRVKRICAHCGQTFDLRPSHHWIQTCSNKCMADMQRATMLAADRRGDRNPNYRGGRRTGVRNRQGEARWNVGRGELCAQCGSRGGVYPVSRHHVIYKQHVRVEGGDVYDPRNALDVCQSCHSKHHRRSSPFPLTLLPDSAFEFARELLGPERTFEYLLRRYTGRDPRVEELARELGPQAIAYIERTYPVERAA